MPEQLAAYKEIAITAVRKWPWVRQFVSLDQTIPEQKAAYDAIVAAAQKTLISKKARP